MSLTWCIPGQGGPLSNAVLQYVKLEGALVPPIWPLEIANILGLKRRYGNLSPVELSDALAVLDLLDIRTEAGPDRNNILRSINNVVRFELAAYDALYVELALRTGLPLATFDRAMIASARRFGVALMGVA